MLKKSALAQDSSKTLGHIFRGIPLHPNIITLLSVVAAVAAYYAFDYSPWYSFGLFLLALFIDAVDGAIARAKNMETRKGAFIDGICDRLVEFIIILTLFYKVGIPAFLLDKGQMLLGVLFFGTCMTSFVKAYAEHSQILKHMQAVKLPGVLERAERVLLLSAVFVLALVNSEFAAPLLFFTAALSFATFVERALRVVTSKDKD